MIIVQFPDYRVTAFIDSDMLWRYVEGDDPLDLVKTLNAFYGGLDWEPVDSSIHYGSSKHLIAAQEAANDFFGEITFEEEGPDIEEDAEQ